jgi:CRP-like cAMP-binding protein
MLGEKPLAQLDHFVGDADRRLGVLAEVGWLASQPAEFRAQMARAGTWRRANAGEVIYLAGDEPDGLYGLAEGALEILYPLVSDEQVALHRAEPGFWIGEAAILSGKTRMVSISAASDCRLFFVPTSKLRRIVKDDPRHLQSILEQSNLNLTTALRLLAEALSLTPRARVARLLLRLADDGGAVEGSQEDFARVLGMTRSSVRRAMASLIDSGIIETGYRHHVIVDPDRLEQLTTEA